MSKNRLTEESFKQYRNIIYPFVLYLCTGKYNVQYKDFMILTDQDFSAQQMSNIYSMLDENKQSLNRIDKDIAYGINRLKNPKNFTNYKGEPIHLFGENSIYSQVKTNSMERVNSYKLYKQTDELVDSLLRTRVLQLNNINRVFVSLKNNKRYSKTSMTFQSYRIHIFVRRFMSNYKALTNLLKYSKSPRVFDILFSKNPNRPSIIKVRDVLNVIRTSKSFVININQDTTEILNKRRIALKRELYKSIPDPYINYKTNSGCEFSDTYVEWMKNSGFRV